MLIFCGTSFVGYVRSRITDLSPGGIEFTFPEREADDEQLKTSYLLYATEYRLIQGLYRYADRLTDAERRRRDADIARSFHPRPLQRLARRFRNFLGSATDSLRDVLAIIVGRVQKTQERFVAAEGTDALTKLGGNVLTEVSSTHDPLLLKRQECTEAGRWLRAAYNKRDDLPDGGRRVRMQLRELSRRVAQRA